MDTVYTTASLLTGITILDMADETAWFCSKIMADMGARVIRIEKPPADIWTDENRQADEFDSYYGNPAYLYNNANKLGITLNINAEEGRELFLKLANSADAIVETFPTGFLKTLDMDYRSLSKLYPAIIMASITGFGSTGPHSVYQSCDIVASAEGGQMYVCGSQETAPLMPHGQQPYYTASLSAATGILIALRTRMATGRGQHVDISLQEATAATVEHVLLRYFQEGIIPKRQGPVHWNNAASVFPCKDGHMLITFNREWEILVDLLDAEGLSADLKDEVWEDENYRRSHVNHIIGVLTNWTQAHTTKELFEMGQLMRLTWAPVCKPADVIANPQLNDRHFFIRPAEYDTGFLYPGMPCRIGTGPGSAMQHAPRRGEHNKLIYSNELGITPDEFDRLKNSGII